MISNAKRATTIVKMQTVMRPLSELAVVCSLICPHLVRIIPPDYHHRTDRAKGTEVDQTTKPDQNSNHKMVER